MVQSPLDRAAKRMLRQFEITSEIPEFASYVSKPLDYQEGVIGGKTVRVLGETHLSRAPFDYFRENIERKVMAKPKEWLFFIEGRRNNKILGGGSPWYFTQVAKLSRIPLFDATDPGVLSEETRSHVMARTGLTQEQFYAIYLNFITTEFPNPSGSTRNISRIARDLEVDVPTAKRIIEDGPLALDFEKYIGPFWNELISRRFRETLESHPDKANVLVSCGYMHNSCFVD